MEIKLHKNLPLYKLSIDEFNDAFVDGIGIVETPAIGAKAMYFANIEDNSNIKLEVKETSTKQFFASEFKQELLGAAMIPDLPMYRPANDIIDHEHYVAFTAEEIRTIARVFFSRGCQNNINVGHTDKTASSNSFISYFIDETKGIGTPQGMDKLPEGTWVLGMYVSDKDLFNQLQASNMGFSVEGLFSYSKFEKADNKEVSLLKEELEEYENFLQSIRD